MANYQSQSLPVLVLQNKAKKEQAKQELCRCRSVSSERESLELLECTVNTRETVVLR
mgnify:CR=1 FL=1